MATIFRDWIYRYQWLYDAISRLAALSVSVAGEAARVFSLIERRFAKAVAVVRVASLTKGRGLLHPKGEGRFRQLALQGLTIESDSKVLDLCCGSGQATQVLVKYSQNVTGLDAFGGSLQLIKARK